MIGSYHRLMIQAGARAQRNIQRAAASDFHFAPAAHGRIKITPCTRAAETLLIEKFGVAEDIVLSRPSAAWLAKRAKRDGLSTYWRGGEHV